MRLRSTQSCFAILPSGTSRRIDWCLERLAHYKCPRTVDFVDARPRQDNGKIYKRRLRERYRDTQTRGGRSGGTM